MKGESSSLSKVSLGFKTGTLIYLILFFELTWRESLCQRPQVRQSFSSLWKQKDIILYSALRVTSGKTLVPSQPHRSIYSKLWLEFRRWKKAPVAAVVILMILLPLIFLSQACVTDVVQRRLVTSARQHWDPCSVPKQTQRIPGRGFWISLQSDWQIDKAFFNRPIMASTQILVQRWGPRTRISALIHRQTYPESSFICATGYLLPAQIVFVCFLLCLFPLLL